VQWLRAYVRRRYGDIGDDTDIQRAWQLLLESVYATNTFAKVVCAAVHALCRTRALCA
jgi:hypothetical protein